MNFYCQSNIEDNGKCEIQCDHCKEYYKPIEDMNKIPPFTLEGRTIDLSKNKITVKELIKWINSLEWQGYERQATNN